MSLAVLLVLTPNQLVYAQDEGNLYDTAFDVRTGARYFQRQCSRCHGQDATGNDETGAPNLTGRLRNANTDAGIYRIIREGISGTAMLPISPDTPDATAWQLVAYINSLSNDPANVELPGDPERGRDLYASSKANCRTCHMIEGEGGRLGPDLSRIGENRSADELMLDLTQPAEEVAPRWWTLRATLRNGDVIEGLRMNEDTFTMRIMDSEMNLWSLAKNQLISSEQIKESSMPSYSSELSQSELDDLVAYLFFTLRRE